MQRTPFRTKRCCEVGVVAPWKKRTRVVVNSAILSHRHSREGSALSRLNPRSQGVSNYTSWKRTPSPEHVHSPQEGARQKIEVKCLNQGSNSLKWLT
jgi:hypothetical protein